MSFIYFTVEYEKFIRLVLHLGMNLMSVPFIYVVMSTNRTRCWSDIHRNLLLYSQQDLQVDDNYLNQWINCFATNIP